MYNLLVTYGNHTWDGRPYNFPAGRIFTEYTVDPLKAKFLPFSYEIAEQVKRYPTLFAYEQAMDAGPTRVGWITSVSIRATEVRLEYVFEELIPPLPNNLLGEHERQLDIGNMEVFRTHWALKDVDLFSVLIEEEFIPDDLMQKVQRGSRLFNSIHEPAAPAAEIRPTVFRIPSVPIDPRLVSIMMPFGPGFDPVHEALRNAVEALGYRCQRADDIWEESEVIQDIVALIHRSKVVICDFSERNTNVFYEAGIAHTIGRPVIPVTQSRRDIPFDLQHHRYIEYLNNAEGLRTLTEKLLGRLKTLMSR